MSYDPSEIIPIYRFVRTAFLFFLNIYYFFTLTFNKFHEDFISINFFLTTRQIYIDPTLLYSRVLCIKRFLFLFFFLVCSFPGNQTHELGVVNIMHYYSCKSDSVLNCAVMWFCLSLSMVLNPAQFEGTSTNQFRE